MAALVFWSKPQYGNTTISLNSRVPITSKMNPGISHHTGGSSPREIDKIQMVSVREVSIVERWAADAYFVMAIPVELNKAIDKIVRKKRKIIMVFWPIYHQAYAEFSK